MRCLLLASLATVAIGAATATPALAASQWTEVQALSADDASGELPQVAIADDGSAVAVWRQDIPAHTIGSTVVPDMHRVEYATRSRGLNFCVPGASGCPAQHTYLSGPTLEVRPWIRLKMNKRGDAIVVWEDVEPSTGRIGIRSAYKPAGGAFGAEQVVSAAAASEAHPASLVEPEAGIDGNGVSTVIYHRPPVAFGTPPGTDQDSRYFSKSRPAGAASSWDSDVSAQEVVTTHQAGSETSPIEYTEASGSLVVDEAGNRTAMLTSQEEDATGTLLHQDVFSSRRGPGAGAWSSRQESFDNPSPDEHHSTRVASRDGLDLLGWTQASDIYASFNESTFGPVQTFNGPRKINDTLPANTTTSGSAFTIDSNDAGLALWSDGTLLHANLVPPSDDFANPTPDANPIAGNVSTNGNGDPQTRTRPTVATDSSGAAIAVFQQKELDDSKIMVAERPPGGGTKFDAQMTVNLPNKTTRSGAPVALSAPGDSSRDGQDLETDDPAGNPPKTGTGPSVAVNADGEGVVAWSRQDPTIGTTRVEVSLLIPQTSSGGSGGGPGGSGGGPGGSIPLPPPPPPPPKPEFPSLIELARPQGRDQATVLKANVPDDTRQLKWSFKSKDEPPIEGDVVDGQLQKSVRIRLPNLTYSATLEVVQPNGIKTVGRSFTSLQTSAAKVSQEVQHGLDRLATPPVFATGVTDSLTGKSGGCAPTSVWSGQQKMSGCLKPIDNLADIPNLEKGAIHELADQLHVDETKKEVMQKASELTDGYVAQGQALLNDTFPVTPEQASHLVDIPQAKALISAKAQLPVGSATFDPKNGFNLKLDPKKAVISLGKLAKPPKLPSLGGLEIVGDWDVNLEKREAKIKASLVLPQEISKAGIKFANSIELTATPDRVIVDKASLGPIDANLGALNVTAFKIAYDAALDEWDGQAKACSIVAACIDMAPPNGHITIQHGNVTFAGASVIFPPPGIEVFPLVDITKIGFGIGFDPTRLIGSGQISAAQIVALDGRLALAFPSSRTPFILRRDEVGNDFAPELYGQSFTRPTIGLAGGVSFKVPETDEELRFGHAYALYEYPGYVALGGGGHIDIVGIIQLDGELTAAVDFPAERFNIHGDVSACLFESNDICGRAVANISHGPHREGGAGACIGIGPLSVGGGVQWARVTDPFIWPLDGCKWSRFAIDVHPSSARAAQVAQTYHMTVRAGALSPVLKLFGKGGPPLVRVSGPGGQVLDATSARKLDFTPDGKIRILRFAGLKSGEQPATLVGLQNARPGTYTVQALPGSPPISGSAHATDQPDAHVSGRVIGTGRKRVLFYNVSPRENQKVTFQEIEPGGPAKTIGVIAGGGHGRIAFNSAPGHGRRQVVAQFELNSLPAERKVIAGFKPQSPRIGKPHPVTVRRRRGRVLVSWQRVAGATHYELAVLLSSRRAIFKTTRRTHVTLKVPVWLSGRVTVRAMDDLRTGEVARSTHRFSAIGPEPSPFRPLVSCRVHQRSISCGPVRGPRCPPRPRDRGSGRDSYALDSGPGRKGKNGCVRLLVSRR